MSQFLKECKKFYFTKNLYEVLNIDKEAKESEIKKAYYKLSLKVHPDRATEDKDAATKKFQILSKVYAILTDKEKRAVYDETGELDDDSTPERDWSDYWRLLFKKITVEDIEKFKQSYQGSNEEIADVRDAYERFEGDMDKMIEFIPCFEIEDEPRIRSIIETLIKDETVSEYAAFSKEKRKKRQQRQNKYAKEAEEAEELKNELGLGSMNDLEKAIAKKQQERSNEMDDFVKQLEAKYCKKKVTKKRNGKFDTENVSDDDGNKHRPKKSKSSNKKTTSKR